MLLANQTAKQVAGDHPTITSTDTQIIPDVVERTIPAVVSISISADVPVFEQYYDNFWSPFGDFFGRDFGFQIPRQRQIGTEKQEIGGGTGFFVSADGYIVTNKHVVNQDGVEYTVVTHDGTEYKVEVVAKDPSLDVAILKVDAEEGFAFWKVPQIWHTPSELS
ncbi:MAG: trypsin-like peptidase domain-containing protein [Candidatus Paceibacteria bacterium]